MTTDPRLGRSRALVLVVHFAALLGGLAFVWEQWADVAAQQAAVDQSRQTIAELDARLLRSGGIRTAAIRPIRNPFVPGNSASLAGANLQDRVVSAIRAAGGTVTSSQIDTSGTGTAGGAAPAPPAIQLTVSCQIGNAALQRLLYTLETETPALFLDQITVESDFRSSGLLPAGGGEVKISMVVSAYWTGGGKS